MDYNQALVKVRHKDLIEALEPKKPRKSNKESYKVVFFHHSLSTSTQRQLS